MPQKDSFITSTIILLSSIILIGPNRVQAFVYLILMAKSFSSSMKLCPRWIWIFCLFHFSNALSETTLDEKTTDASCSVLPNPTVRLHNGAEMPVFQLGSAQLIDESNPDPDALPGFVGMQTELMYRQVQLALEAGVRAFDAAMIYGSHRGLGYVLGEWWRSGSLSARKDVWITTKIFHPPAAPCLKSQHFPKLSEMTEEEVSAFTEQHFEKSLQELNVGYVDLMLLHWPGQDDASAEKPIDPTMNRKRRLAAWKVLEKMYQKGWCRAIGVSNFDVRHLEQLRGDGATIVPMVNQIEGSVEVQYAEIREYCKKKGIALQAYSALRGLKKGTKAYQLLLKLGENITRILASSPFDTCTNTATIQSFSPIPSIV